MESTDKIIPPRNGQVLNPRASISSLAPEILRCILEYVFETSPLTLPSIVLVSKSFHGLSEDFKWRDQVFHFHCSKPGDPKVTQTAFRKECQYSPGPEGRRSIRSIRTLRICDEIERTPIEFGGERPITQDADMEPNWTVMADCIKTIIDLRDITFKANYPIPIKVLNALERHHPKARLHILNWTRRIAEIDQSDPSEIALGRSPNLRSIQVPLWIYGATDLRLPALRRLISGSPNLERVSSEAFPSKLNTDSDYNCRVMLHRVDNTSPNSIKVLRGNDLESEIQRALNLSALEELQITHITWCNYFREGGRENARFPFLKHLSIESMWGNPVTTMEQIRAAIESFVSCRSLTSLSLANDGALINFRAAFTAHGTSLRSLRLHSRQWSRPNEKRPVLGADQLRLINSLCPHLKEFTVDINHSQDESTEREMFYELAKFSELKIIKFYLFLDVLEEGWLHNVPETNQFYPWNPHFVSNIWFQVCTEKAKNNSTPLEELRVSVGAWNEESLGNSFKMVGDSRSSYHTARRSDRDDRPDEILVQRGLPDGSTEKTFRRVTGIVTERRSEATAKAWRADYQKSLEYSQPRVATA